MDNQTTSPRARMQELLAIPERNRTDAEWDELIELEIVLAPGNRQGAQDQSMRRNNGMPQQGGHNKQLGGLPHNNNKRPGKKFHRRPPNNNKGGGGKAP